MKIRVTSFRGASRMVKVHLSLLSLFKKPHQKPPPTPTRPSKKSTATSLQIELFFNQKRYRRISGIKKKRCNPENRLGCLINNWRKKNDPGTATEFKRERSQQQESLGCNRGSKIVVKQVDPQHYLQIDTRTTPPPPPPTKKRRRSLSPHYFMGSKFTSLEVLPDKYYTWVNRLWAPSTPFPSFLNSSFIVFRPRANPSPISSF